MARHPPGVDAQLHAPRRTLAEPTVRATTGRRNGTQPAWWPRAAPRPSGKPENRPASVENRNEPPRAHAFTPEPRIACPTSRMRCRPAHSWSRVCPRLPVGRGVYKTRRRQDRGQTRRRQDRGPPWSSEEAEEFGEWWWGRRGRWSKEHGKALVVVVAHTCGDEDGDADEQ